MMCQLSMCSGRGWEVVLEDLVVGKMGGDDCPCIFGGVGDGLVEHVGKYLGMVEWARTGVIRVSHGLRD